MEPKTMYIIIACVVILLLILVVVFWPSTSAPQQNPQVPVPPSRQHLGCYQDSSARTLPTQLGSWESVDSCDKLATSAGYKYFGLQWWEGSPDKTTATCWGGNTLPQTKATNCNKGLGGAWANDIYTYN